MKTLLGGKKVSLKPERTVCRLKCSPPSDLVPTLCGPCAGLVWDLGGILIHPLFCGRILTGPGAGSRRWTVPAHPLGGHLLGVYNEVQNLSRMFGGVPCAPLPQYNVEAGKPGPADTEEWGTDRPPCSTLYLGAGGRVGATTGLRWSTLVPRQMRLKFRTGWSFQNH